MVLHNTSRVARESLRISSVSPRGWEPSSGRVPSVGEQVYCTDGPAEVMRVLGKTSDGSRLLELRCSERAQPFFAASSNVLLRVDSDEPVFLDEETDQPVFLDDAMDKPVFLDEETDEPVILDDSME